MAKKKHSESRRGAETGFRFSLTGLGIFSVSLALAGGALTSGVMTVYEKSTFGRDNQAGSVPGGAERQGVSSPHQAPPWGELIESQIQIERPEEYAAREVDTNRAPAWVFEKMSPEKARDLMLSCGLNAGQVDRALSAGHCSVTATSTVVKPDEEMVFSLTPEIRARFYHQLALSGGNFYMQYPFCFPAQKVSDWFEDVKVDAAVVARVKKLLYARGSAMCFSDFELIMASLPAEEQRLALVKALSRQPALLVRVRIGPETDVDGVLNYWGRGLQVKDARPLLESVKRMDAGGNISLLYLLPRFARERLYTYPPPSKPNDTPIDCHWSSMNFFNDTPDDRFANPLFTAQYLTNNFFPVSKPSKYGDIVLVIDDHGNAIHSAVYLADDIVFTKNGNNAAQPWMLMRLQDVLLDYCGEGIHGMVAYRNKKS